MPESGRSSEVVAYIDGGARGNPGPAAYGVVVQAGGGKPPKMLSQFIGEATNNEAEYQGLLAALDYALAHKVQRLKVVSDSELLVRQIRREYKVKSEGLKPLYQRAQEMIGQLESFSIQHVPREQNRQADRLVNEALDAAESRTRPKPDHTLFSSTDAESLRATATHRKGILRLHQPLPLAEGEEIELEIRRKK